MAEDTGSTPTTLAWGRGHVRHGRVPEWLLDSDASDRAVRLYALLATYADRDGRSFPGRKKIMDRLGCRLTAYKAAVADLVRVGALNVSERRRDDGSRTTNGWTLHWDAPGLAAASATGDGRVGGRGMVADAPGSRARDPLMLELEKNPELETSAADAATATAEGPPKLTKIEGRDLAFDALAEVCGVDPQGNRAREVGIALNGSKRHGLALGIRTLAWRELDDDRAVIPGEPFERWLAATIRERGRDYRAGMGAAMLTPLALAKWWTDLDSATQRDPARRAAEEATRLAEEGR